MIRGPRDAEGGGGRERGKERAAARHENLGEDAGAREVVGGVLLRDRRAFLRACGPYCESRAWLRLSLLSIGPASGGEGPRPSSTILRTRASTC
jgi:hypothetical protein